MSLSRFLVLGRTALFAFPAFGSLVACNSPEPLPVFVDIDYQVGCIAQRQGCSTTGPQHQVQAVDGEDGFTNYCFARNVSGATVVELSSEQGSQQRFAIENAVLGDPNNVGTGCKVVIVEGDNTYEGRCSTVAPAGPVSAASQMPCQLTDFRKTASGSITGKLLCIGLPVRNAATLFRDVVKGGTFASPQPAEFLFDPCDGI